MHKTLITSILLLISTLVLGQKESIQYGDYTKRNTFQMTQVVHESSNVIYTLSKSPMGLYSAEQRIEIFDKNLKFVKAINLEETSLSYADCVGKGNSLYILLYKRDIEKKEYTFYIRKINPKTLDWDSEKKIIAKINPTNLGDKKVNYFSHSIYYRKESKQFAFYAMVGNYARDTRKIIKHESVVVFNEKFTPIWGQDFVTDNVDKELSAKYHIATNDHDEFVVIETLIEDNRYIRNEIVDNEKTCIIDSDNAEEIKKYKYRQEDLFYKLEIDKTKRKFVLKLGEYDPVKNEINRQTSYSLSGKVKQRSLIELSNEDIASDDKGSIYPTFFKRLENGRFILAYDQRYEYVDKSSYYSSTARVSGNKYVFCLDSNLNVESMTTVPKMQKHDGYYFRDSRTFINDNVMHVYHIDYKHNSTDPDDAREILPQSTVKLTKPIHIVHTQIDASGKKKTNFINIPEEIAKKKFKCSILHSKKGVYMVFYVKSGKYLAKID